MFLEERWLEKVTFLKYRHQRQTSKFAQVLCRQLTFTVPKVLFFFPIFSIKTSPDESKIQWGWCNGMRQTWVSFFCVMVVSWKQNKEVQFLFGFHFLRQCLLCFFLNTGATATTQAPVPRVWILWGSWRIKRVGQIPEFSTIFNVKEEVNNWTIYFIYFPCFM